MSTVEKAQTRELKPGPVCSVCPLYPSCRQVCEPVENLLPSMERARVDQEDLPKLYMGARSTNLLLDNVSSLTPHQQEVVRLYYRETLQQQEIAELLQVTQQAIHDTLLRARQTVRRVLRNEPRTQVTARGPVATKKRARVGTESHGGNTRSPLGLPRS